MANGKDDLGVGTGPAPLSNLTGPGFEADEKALKKGRGRMLAAMVAAVVLVIAGLALYLSSGDDETYTKFGQHVNGFDGEYFDQFWGCALDGTNLREVRSDQDLRDQINRRVTNGKERYARHLRDDCLPKLAELGPKLESLLPPEEFRPHVRDLTDAVRRLRGATSDFIAHVEGLGDNAYDPDLAEDPLTRIARAWFDYRNALNTLNTDLRKHLGRG